MRVDRWLWCARFFKTRNLAARAVRDGKVRVEGERVKVSRELRVGNPISVRRGELITDIQVLKIPARRGPSAEAMGLYQETAASVERRERGVERRKAQPRLDPPTHGRPDKRTRRLVRTHRRGGPLSPR